MQDGNGPNKRKDLLIKEWLEKEYLKYIYIICPSHFHEGRFAQKISTNCSINIQNQPIPSGLDDFVINL